MKPALDPFDATRKFKSLVFFRADGTIWEPGSAIDGSRFTERGLKLLYENRRIGYITDEELAALAQREADDAQERADAAALAAGTGGTAHDPVAARDPLLATSATASDADKEAAAKALVDAHTKDELVAKAADAGVDVKPSDTKPVIAAALVGAGVAAPTTEAPAEPAAPAQDAAVVAAAPQPDSAPAAAETGSEQHAAAPVDEHDDHAADTRAEDEATH